MIALEKVLMVLVSTALVWGAIRDWRIQIIPLWVGLGMLAVGLTALLLPGRWLAAAFYLSAIWGSRGGIWRLPIAVMAILLIGEGGISAVPLALGILYTLRIFWLGWFGGGDAQVAFGLIALGSDWWILAYLFGGTILVGLALMVAKMGVTSAGRRAWHVLRNMDSPDEEALQLPWGVLAAAAGLVYIWIWPGSFLS